MSNTQELIDAARSVIGESDKNKDWRIAPSEHAECFEEQAAPIAKILRGSLANGLAKMYEECDEKAIKARDLFKHTVAKANCVVFFTASLGALLLVAGGLQEVLAEAARWVVGAIGLLGVISGSLAAMWITQVKSGGLADRWAQERARAEAKRLAYFKAIISETSERPFDQLLALEYTRRFLLDSQIYYFRKRGSEHEGAAGTALKASTQSVFVASTATAVAGLLSMRYPQLAVVAGLGVVASAYAALVVSRSAVNLDRRNADRYRLAEDQLEDRKLAIDAYREKAALGDKKAVEEFFESVFVTLTTDHKGFLNDAEKREAAIGAMERRLSAASEALNKKPAGEAGNP